MAVRYIQLRESWNVHEISSPYPVVPFCVRIHESLMEVIMHPNHACVFLPSHISSLHVSFLIKIPILTCSNISIMLSIPVTEVSVWSETWTAIWVLLTTKLAVYSEMCSSPLSRWIHYINDVCVGILYCDAVWTSRQIPAVHLPPELWYVQFIFLGLAAVNTVRNTHWVVQLQRWGIKGAGRLLHLQLTLSINPLRLEI
jgi:hypothetical protein